MLAAFSSIIWSNSLAHHLPGLRAFVRLVVEEIERRRQLAAGIDELHAVLLDEMACLHLVEHVQPLEHPIGLGNQRLADMEARKLLALEQLDANALLGQQRGDGRARRSAANDDDLSGVNFRHIVILPA